MSRKNDFKEFLKSKQQPTKAKAIELCGETFIDELTAQKIFAKDELFWERVCEKLNIPECQKQRQLKAEQEEIEKERLLANLKLFEKRNRNGWEVLIYELPDSDIFGKKYVATGQKGDETIDHLDNSYYWGNTPNNAFGRICSSIDSIEDRIQRNVEFQKTYLILKPIYLLFLYISGNDDYHYSLSREKNKENFLGMQSWIKLQFEILDLLEQEELIEQSQKKGNNPKTVTYVDITKKGMKEAREILRNINLEEAEKFLKKYDYHEEYINHKNQRELWLEEYTSDNLENDSEVN